MRTKDVLGDDREAFAIITDVAALALVAELLTRVERKTRTLEAWSYLASFRTGEANDVPVARRSTVPVRI